MIEDNEVCLLMHVGNAWLVPGRVLASVYAGPINLAVITEGTTRSHQWVEAEGTPPVHIIGDARLRGPFSHDLLSLSALGPVSRRFRHNPRLGWNLLVDPSPHPVGFVLCNALARAGNFRFRLFPSMAAAIAFLQSVDPSLPPVIDTTNLPRPPADVQPVTHPATWTL